VGEELVGVAEGAAVGDVDVFGAQTCAAQLERDRGAEVNVTLSVVVARFHRRAGSELLTKLSDHLGTDFERVE
jgi:hypothetical protein